MKYFEIDSIGNVFVSKEPHNMGKSFKGLIELAEKMGRNPDSGSLFVFYNARKTYCKVLFYNDGGYCIFAKRLDAGRFIIDENTTKFSLKELSIFLQGEPVKLAKAA